MLEMLIKYLYLTWPLVLMGTDTFYIATKKYSAIFVCLSWYLSIISKKRIKSFFWSKNVWPRDITSCHIKFHLRNSSTNDSVLRFFIISLTAFNNLRWSSFSFYMYMFRLSVTFVLRNSFLYFWLNILKYKSYISHSNSRKIDVSH